MFLAPLCIGFATMCVFVPCRNFYSCLSSAHHVMFGSLFYKGQFKVPVYVLWLGWLQLSVWSYDALSSGVLAVAASYTSLS